MSNSLFTTIAPRATGATTPMAVQTPSIVLAARVRDASSSERAGWDQLVTRFDNYQIAHKAAWIRSLEASGLGDPLYLVFERGGRIVGCVPGLLVRKGPIRIFGSPLPGWQTAGMGPAFDASAISTGEMMTLLVDYLERRHHVHHIELVTGEVDRDAMLAAGFRGEQVMTFRCAIHRDESVQMKALKDSARRNIRRATRLGIVVRFEEDEAFVDEHYDQVKEVFRRGGNAVPFSKARALAYFRCLKTSGNLVAVGAYLRDESRGNPCIATGLFTIEGKELLLWTWTHRTQDRWYRPTELMTWTVMRLAAARGCDTFDLNGRGDFKTRFGATLDGTRYRWVRSRYAWLRALRDVAELGYRRQQAARGRIARKRELLLESLAAWRSGRSVGPAPDGVDA